MRLQDLTDKVADGHGVPRAQAKQIVTTVLSSITDAARSGTEVSLPGFGKFRARERAARQARNLRNRSDGHGRRSQKKLVY